VSDPEPETILTETAEEKKAEQPEAAGNEPEPETILAEAPEEKAAEQPETPAENKEEVVKSEGGEN
jgi:hypothetical protein